ncbi:MAG: methionine ABC transporter ATP-binding protein, partial [Deltaproteobacteria bacterium]|nr:methionine ABC transporter ATP-binding protein [Deltaproteobacteria bacterium]
MIRITGLHKQFKGRQVLRDINMRVEAGEVFGLVGHSGAGKSTLLRCLNGLEGYDAGSVRVMGLEVGALRERELLRLRRRMGMIFQNFNLMERRNVFENVAFPLELWKTPKAELRARVEELLCLVGLEHKSLERPSSLSGGQKQRVGIARALALSPDILLCDEATSALDPRTTMSILDLLRDINIRLGLTIVLVTHQMEVVKRMCRRVLILDEGLARGAGDTAELFLDPPEQLRRLTREEYALIPSGVNIRLGFPREISREMVISNMARDLDLGFSIVGGRLERYGDDVLGFLIINVRPEDKEKAL